MKLLDTLKLRILRNKLKKGKKIKNIDSLDTEQLLYSHYDDRTIFEYILGYKKNFGKIPLSILNADWEDKRLLNIIYSYSSSVSEDDLFLKYKDKYLIRIIIEQLNLKPSRIKNIVNYINKHYLEMIDVLVEINDPAYIIYFNKTAVQLIRKNKDIILDKYKDKYYVFETILRLFEDKQEVIDICKKYNREFLLNNIFSETNKGKVVPVKPTLDNKYENNNEISEESEMLLKEFFNLYAEKNGARFKLVYDAFYNSLKDGNETSKQMIERLIEIKKEHPEFKIVLDPKHSDFFNSKPPTVQVNPLKFAPAVLFHELTHAIHFFNNNMAIQYDLSNALEILRANPEQIIEKYERFKEVYLKIEASISEIAKEKIGASIQEGIGQYSNRQIVSLDGLNIEDEYKQQIASLSNYEQKFFEYKKHIMTKEFIDHYLRLNYPEIMEISDIFDSIFSGIVHSYNPLFGHGTKYFSRQDKCTSEIIADFTAIKCMPNAEKLLENMQLFFGEDLYEIIEKSSKDALGFTELSKSIGR